jgi:hypothetical protein
MNDTEKYLEKLENDFGYMLTHTSGYVYPGWEQLIRDMLQEIVGTTWPDVLAEDTESFAIQHPQFTDIKDKFGSLRVYGFNITDEQQVIIDKYEKLSTETCATCGAKGELRVKNQWLYVACEEHGH